MTRRVILVRHASHAELGRVLSGRSRIALDAAGRAEADRLAAAVARDDAATLHSSPLHRALETAAPIATRLGLAAQVVPALDEIDFGSFAGRGFAELGDDADWRRWNAHRHTARCPGGETMAEAVARARNWLDALPDAAFPTLCVTHCDIVRGLVVSMLGLGFDRILDVACDPASRTVVELAGGGRGRLVALNREARS